MIKRLYYLLLPPLARFADVVLLDHCGVHALLATRFYIFEKFLTLLSGDGLVSGELCVRERVTS